MQHATDTIREKYPTLLAHAPSLDCAGTVVPGSKVYCTVSKSTTSKTQLSIQLSEEIREDGQFPRVGYHPNLAENICKELISRRLLVSELGDYDSYDAQKTFGNSRVDFVLYGSSTATAAAAVATNCVTTSIHAGSSIKTVEDQAAKPAMKKLRRNAKTAANATTAVTSSSSPVVYSSSSEECYNNSVGGLLSGSSSAKPATGTVTLLEVKNVVGADFPFGKVPEARGRVGVYERPVEGYERCAIFPYGVQVRGVESGFNGIVLGLIVTGLYTVCFN
jgi:hypothetical protein